MTGLYWQVGFGLQQGQQTKLRWDNDMMLVKRKGYQGAKGQQAFPDLGSTQGHI